MRDQGYLAVVLVDLGALAQIEKSFGGAVFRSLREQVDPLLEEMRERFRGDDVLTRDESEGDRFLLFVGGPRRGGALPLRAAAQARRPSRGVPERARRAPGAALPARAPAARRGLRGRALEPAREPRAAGAAARGRGRGLRRDARKAARSRPARAPGRDHPEPRDLDRLPADRLARDGRAARLGGAVARPARLRDRAAAAALRPGGALRADRGARTVLPAAGVRRLAGARPARAAVREHRALRPSATRASWAAASWTISAPGSRPAR